MKKLKKLTRLICFITLCLILAFTTQGISPVKAMPNTPPKIISAEIPKDSIKFTGQEFQRHKSSLARASEKLDFNNHNIGKFHLGTPFSVLHYENNEITNPNIYYFPVLGNDEIIALFSVENTINGQYSATFSKSFAIELNNALKNNKNKSFRFNDNAEINKLVEACLWTTDFYVFTMRGFEGYEVMELAKEGAVRKEMAELYNKFYESQYIEDRWRICYKG